MFMCSWFNSPLYANMIIPIGQKIPYIKDIKRPLPMPIQYKDITIFANKSIKFFINTNKASNFLLLFYLIWLQT